MAISKQRLEELIKKGATIYSIYGNSIKLSNNDSGYPAKTYIKENTFVKELVEYEDFCITYTFDQLFETKQEVKDFSEWREEFYCIERTERLVLPTWEEIKKDLKDVPVGDYVISEFDNVALVFFKCKKGKELICLYKSNDYRNEWIATKENYTLACRKCKELFLGGRYE